MHSWRINQLFYNILDVVFSQYGNFLRETASNKSKISLLLTNTSSGEIRSKSNCISSKNYTQLKKMIGVVILYSEIVILDEIRSAYLAIRFQSLFAHSSGLPNNCAPKGKAKKGLEIFRGKRFIQIDNICCWGPEKLRFHYVYTTRVKDLRCLNRCLLVFTARNYFKDISTLRNNIYRAKECSKLAKFHFCRKI